MQFIISQCELSKASVSFEAHRLGTALTGLFVMCCFDMYPVGSGSDCLFHCICLQARLEIHLINAEPNPRRGIHRDDDDADVERCTTGDFFFNNTETGSI